MPNAPFTQRDLPRSVLLNTAAQWALNGGVLLTEYQTARETDTGREKTGPGLFSELQYDSPQGQTWENTSGTPTATDLIGYTAVTEAIAATAEWTTLDAGTEDATIIVGGKLYTVVASGASGDEIDAGADELEYATNIAAKVTTDTADTLCTAAEVAAVITFTANDSGAAGNDIALNTDDANITADVFVDGADAIYTPKAATFADLGTGDAAFQSLTDGATITWTFDGAESRNAEVIITDDRDLDITGATNGASGTLKVVQGAGGAHALALPAGSKVIADGQGVVTLSAGVGDIDFISFVYDGTTFFWTVGLDFTAA